MKYVQATISHHERGEWRAYVPHLDITVIGSSEEKVKYAAFSAVEEAEGLHSFSIVWAG